MKRLLLINALLILSTCVFSQSKKEQIDLLTNRVDSLLKVISVKNQLIDAKQAQIYSWQKELVSNKENLAAAQSNIQELTTKISALRDSVLQLTKKNQALIAEQKAPAEVPTAKNNKNNTAGGKTEQRDIKENSKGLQTTWAYVNLDVSLFRNGDSIPEAKTDAAWLKAGSENKPAWCYYGYDAANGKIYGKLYNWYAVNDPRGLAPAGWHIPTMAEWNELTSYFGSDAGKKMKSSSGWSDFKGRSGNGTNSSGFDGFPGGMRYGDGTYNYLGTGGYWWTSSENKAGSAWHRALYNTANNVIKSYSNKQNGLSVRCVKD